MPEIKVQHVVSVSSEDKHYPAKNLVKQDGFKKWKCVAGEKQAIVAFQKCVLTLDATAEEFEKAVEVKQIDIGNEGSAFIEVLVGKSTSTEDDYEVILVASSFMSPAESRSNQNPNRVRIFNSDQLSQAVINQKWDRAKVICTQPFNKSSQYGLSFIKFHSSPESGTAAGEVKSEIVEAESLGAFKLRTEVETGLIRTGSLFEKIKSKTESVVPATGPAAIRAASKMAEQSTLSTEDVENGQKSRNNAEHRTYNNLSKEKSKVIEERSADNKNVNKQKSKEVEERSTSTPPPTKKSRTETTSSQKTKPFERLMSDVVFTLSGFQNPERSDLRDAALEMGAKFRSDWTDGCTHLVCAFEGTPKYEQVSGKGFIVKKSWITECHSQKKLLPWRKYRLGRAPTPDIDNSETDEDADTMAVTVQQKNSDKKNDIPVSDDIKERTTTNSNEPAKNIKSKDSKTDPTTSKDKSDEEWDPFEDDIGVHSDCDTEEEIRRFEENQSRKTTASNAAAASTLSSPSSHPCVATSSEVKIANNDDVYNVSTDEEPSVAHNGKTDQAVYDDDGFPVLPEFMSGKTFFLYGKLLDRRSIIRYITAYNGILADYMGDTVKYVITDSEWDESFDEALSDNPDLVFIRSSWIEACHKSQKLLPHQKFAVVADA